MSEERTGQRVKQKDIAKATGLSEAVITKYKKGKAMPGAIQLAKLAEFFGVTTDSFLGRDPEGKTDPVFRVSPKEEADEWRLQAAYATERLQEMQHGMERLLAESRRSLSSRKVQKAADAIQHEAADTQHRRGSERRGVPAPRPGPDIQQEKSHGEEKR